MPISASGRTASMHGSTTSSPSRSRSGRCAARSTTRSARYRGGGISSFSRLISNQGAIPARRNACEILEISQQPLDVFELELRAEVLAEAPAQFFQNAPRALHVDLARHLDRRVVAVVAPAQGPAERVGLLLGAWRPEPAVRAGTQHALLLHRLGEVLRAPAQSFEDRKSTRLNSSHLGI